MSSSSSFREPFTLDLVLRKLDKVPFSPPFIVILPLLAVLLGRRSEGFPDMLMRLPSLGELYEALFVRHRILFGMAIFAFLKWVSRKLARRAMNNGDPTPDKPRWKEDVIVVTGGAMGIGKEVVQILSREYGARLAVLDVLDPTYAPASNGAPEILFIRTDVTSEKAVAEAHAKIIERFGRSPSHVVHCAGVAPGGAMLSCGLKMYSRVYDINTLANVVLAQAFVPSMIKNNHGHFMSIASSASYYTLPNNVPYSMSKAAALAFMEGLRVELRYIYKAPRVRTTFVTPAKVRTVLAEALNDTKDPFVSPSLEPIQVARQMTDALASGLGHNITTPLAMTLLPYLRAFPEWFRAFLHKTSHAEELVTEESIRRGLAIARGSQTNEQHMKDLGIDH